MSKMQISSVSVILNQTHLWKFKIKIIALSALERQSQKVCIGVTDWLIGLNFGQFSRWSHILLTTM